MPRKVSDTLTGVRCPGLTQSMVAREAGSYPREAMQMARGGLHWVWKEQVLWGLSPHSISYGPGKSTSLSL